MKYFARAKRKLLPFIPPILINFYTYQKSKPSKFAKANEIAIKDFAQSFELLEFSLIDLQLPFDLKWG